MSDYERKLERDRQDRIVNRSGELGAQFEVSREMSIQEILLQRAAMLHAEAESLQDLARSLPQSINGTPAARALHGLVRKSL